MASLRRAVTTSSPDTFGFGHPTLFIWLRAWLRVKSFPHFGKEQIKRRKTGASNIEAETDRCKQKQTDRQTVSLVDVAHSLDNKISPPKFIWSAQPRCWPQPID